MIDIETNDMSFRMKVMGSNAWDEIFSLPLIPMHNNPHLYSHYVMKMLGYTPEIHKRLSLHAKNCRTSFGVFNKWPDGSGGNMSFDEIMGICAHHKWVSQEILGRLLKTDGIYVNSREDVKPYELDEKHYVYRMVFLKPFLRACAGYKVNLISQAQFSFFLIVLDLLKHDFKKEDFDLEKKDYKKFRKKLNAPGRLRIWVTLDFMEKYPLSKLAVNWWRKAMHKKGITPKVCFNHYLDEVPIMREIAPESF